MGYFGISFFLQIGRTFPKVAGLFGATGRKTYGLTAVFKGWLVYSHPRHPFSMKSFSKI
jgi:hypothetical protein